MADKNCQCVARNEAQREESMKTCTQCGKQKPTTEFYAHSRMADGQLSKCKTCICSNVRKRRLNNLDRIREYDICRAKLPHRKELTFAQTKKWRNKDRRRAQCHSAVARAVKSGKLVRGCCSVCGAENSVAHHEDYDKPLDVVWYCQAHHKERHAQIDAEKNIERKAA